MKRLNSGCQPSAFGISNKLLPEQFRVWLLALLLMMVTHFAYSQQVQVIKMPALEKMMAQNTDTTYVINFWATWCGPCLKELAYFDQLNTNYAKDKVKVILVSLDAASKLEGKVKPLVQKNKIKSAVFLLDEPDQNSWIDKVDKDWSGSLPFTIFLNNDRKKRKTFERAFTKEELETELLSFMK